MRITTKQSRRSELLEEHFAESFPPETDKDFLGKEHFWKLGEEVGYSRAVVSEFFSHLIFPTVGGRLTTFETLPIDEKKPKTFKPIKFGLIVKPRNEVGLAYPPVPINSAYPSLREMIHNHKYKHEFTTEDLAIQAGSFLSGITAGHDFSRIMTAKSLRMLPQIGNVLLSHLEQN